MSKIKFSVLMSVYKNDKTEYVKTAINSVLNQTLKPDQYVIMIDGPIDDDLKNLLLKYKKKNDIIELHFREENKGLGITLNEGLNYCKYEYVARMDSDDEATQDRFEKQIYFLQLNPDIDVVGCNMYEYDDTMTEVLSRKIVPETIDEIRNYVKFRNPFNHPTVIFKKEKIIAAGSYENYLLFEDYYLWAKLIKNNCKMHNLQDYLYKFRGGSSLYYRRGGISYIRKMIYFEKGLLNLGIINKITYLKNIFKRSIGALIPNKIRGYLYKKILRG